MKTNILTLAITLTLGIILAGSLLVPVINDVAQPDAVIKTNSGSINADVIENGDSGSIILDNTALKITINDTLQTYAPTGAVNVLYGENAYLNHNANATTFSLATTEDGTTTTTTGLTEISYSAANDKLTIIAGSDTFVVGLGLTLIWGDSGDYTAAFKQNGSTIYYSEADPYLLSVGGYGAKNGAVFPSTYTLTDNHALVEGSQDVYQVKYSAADFILKDGSDNAASAGAWMMVSKEVQGIGEEKVSAGEKALYLAIPVLVIISLVLGAVSIVVKRD